MANDTPRIRFHPSRPIDLDRLREQIRERIHGRVVDFHLDVTDRGLILTGRTYSWYGKQLAQQVAMEITGHPIASNGIEVVKPRYVDETTERGHDHVS